MCSPWSRFWNKSPVLAYICQKTLANIFPGGIVCGHPIISSTYPAQSVVRRSVILSDFHSEVDKVADKVSDMVADINTKIDINMEIQFGERVGHRVG